MENTVDMMQQGNVLDDAAQAPEEPQGEALSSLMEEEQPEQEQQTEQPQDAQTSAKEPGWVRKRIDQAIARERRAWEAEQEQKLAPLYESMYDRQAQELVSSGEFKSLDRAKEYVRMKHGAVSIPASEPQPSAQENAVDPVIKARADLLSQQAKKIKANSGIDVMAAFNADPEIQQKLASGEWDFYDVADAMRSSKRSVPSPMRSPNGTGFESVNIQNMSEAQWKRLQENLAGGRRYDMRK